MESPQHDKARESESERMAIGGFIDFCEGRGFFLAERQEWTTVYNHTASQLVIVSTESQKFQRLLSEYLGIDYDAYMQEKEEAYRLVSYRANQSPFAVEP
jgi:hypothetical protein